jgi:hypothetical protein
MNYPPPQQNGATSTSRWNHQVATCNHPESRVIVPYGSGDSLSTSLPRKLDVVDQKDAEELREIVAGTLGEGDTGVERLQ